MNNKIITNKKLEKQNKQAFKKSEMLRQEIKEQVFYNDGLIIF
jgi:hypothetical protein